MLGLMVTGCGRADKAVRSSRSAAQTIPGINTALPPNMERGTIETSAIPPGQSLRGDGDADNPGDEDGNGDIDPEDGDSDYPVPESYRFPDNDDKATYAYGRRPSAGAARAIQSVVERYYAAASAGDGATGCSLLPPIMARSVPEDYGQSGPSSERGKTCQAVLSRIFLDSHEPLAEAITVVEVRVSGSMAQAVFSSRKMRASSIFLIRQGGVWKVQELLGRPLP
jgi:hypothetical protein